MGGSSEIQLIVSDFGGVICTYDYRIFCRRLAQRIGGDAEAIYTLVYRSDLQEDFERGRLSGPKFHRLVMRHLGTDVPYPEFFRMYGDIFTEIPGTVAGQAVVLHLDSGAPNGLSLPTAFASQMTLDGPLVDRGYAKTVDQVMPIRGATLRGVFTIGRYSLEHPPVRFVDIARNVGNVGAAILRQFAITIDPAQTRLRLAGPADGRLAVIEVPRPYYGVQLDAIDANPLEVGVVDQGSPAEKSGLRAGDQIVRLNGRPIDAVDVDGRVDALKNSPLRLTVKRGPDTLDLTMALQ